MHIPKLKPYGDTYFTAQETIAAFNAGDEFLLVGKCKCTSRLDLHQVGIKSVVLIYRNGEVPYVITGRRP